ncbi:MFS transporter [Moraxella osloensis]|jgi:MFS family permease|uniref:Muropeptide transporter n=1 Tax=Faucicola osloensis TaxID=34062 RepID=A0A378QX61_FAUOS|nr:MULTISPECIES: MFS transporter [Pseudomonadota]AME02578.1 MFS transporter [Moraxella osloensis]OBX57212.1 MFS transporter [Moraxella osloensis]STZ04930.1 muropeptide transporter [Moraxella osloensis]VXB23699.1 Muropeptide transporter [Enhydrobacter sp. 8BJ]
MNLSKHSDSASHKVFHRLLPMVAMLYIAHALPLYFFNVAVPAILRQQGVDVRWIGMLSLLYLPWALKFFWATVVDNHYSERIGKRKTWLLSTQIIIVIGLITLSQLGWLQITALLLVSFIISSAAATQDIAIDGYTVEQFDKSQFGMVSATQSLGVAFGSMLGGAGVLWLYHSYSWQVAILSLAGVVSLISMLLIRLPDATKAPNRPIIKSQTLLPSMDRNHTSKSLDKASLKKFFARADVKWILLLIVVFRFVEAPAMAMLNPMLVDFGWSLNQIGFLFSVLGAIVGILSAISAGFLVKKQGAERWLLISGWLRSAVYGLLFLVLLSKGVLLAQTGLFGQTQFATLLSISVLLLLGIRYLTMTALYTLFMNHTSKQQAGTDFTVFVCIELLVFFIGGAVSGFLVHSLGYQNLFLLLMSMSVISVSLTPFFLKKMLLKKNHSYEAIS